MARQLLLEAAVPGVDSSESPYSVRRYLINLMFITKRFLLQTNLV